MSHYFTSLEAGKRYGIHRPKVHDVVIGWLESSCPERRFKKGIDIACGTGDSLRPLRRICDEAIGVDSSDEMLSVALDQCLPVIKGDYSDIADIGSFDLLSTCMAFHWFDLETAISSYKAASNNGAIWLIYNFAFDGHETSGAFNKWYFKSYLEEYPSPPRNRTAPGNLDEDESLSLIKKDHGWLPIRFTAETLVGYLSTQSNIEQVVIAGCPVGDVTQELLNQLSRLDLRGNFKYYYSYEIYEYASR